MRHLLPAAALWRGSEVEGVGDFAVDLGSGIPVGLRRESLELLSGG